jgi:hypothetical protein
VHGVAGAGRPALSDEQVQPNAAGLVELKLKTPWRDGTKHLAMSQMSSCSGMSPAAKAVRASGTVRAPYGTSGCSAATISGR